MSEETVSPNLPPQTPFTPIDQELYENRYIFVNGMVSSEMALKVNKELFAMERKNPDLPIYIWINSPGGEVTSGFSIYDTIQFIKPKVFTIVSGLAASMGSVIALAAEKENRLAMPNGRILIHQPLISGVMRGSASDLEIHAKDIIEMKKRFHRLYAERTGTSIEKYQELMERDRWIDADEAVELGLISKVLKSKDDLKA